MTTNKKALYLSTFAAAKMDVPQEPNVEFSFVVRVPKEYVMDAWDLPRSAGGAISLLGLVMQKSRAYVRNI